MRAFTLATSETLPNARVLAASLRRHQPDWSLEIVLMDRRDVPVAGEPTPIRRLSDQIDLDIAALLSLHEEPELRRLVLPRVMLAYARRREGPVLHLPPTAWVLAPLEPVEASLRDHSVMLAARARADPPDDGLLPSPEQLDRAGRIDETVIAVDGTVEADGMLTWLAVRTEAMLGTLDGRPSRMRPEDRPWLARMLELAPARFGAAVPTDPGCNLSMWSLPLHSLTEDSDGPCVDGRFPVRFINLPGFDPRHPSRLSKLASRVRVSTMPALRALCVQYTEELLACGWNDLHRRSEIGRELVDGVVFDESLCSLYARALALGEDFGDVFTEAGAAAFLAWLQGPAPAGSHHGINRYVFFRVSGERPDVLRAYPDLDGPDGSGFLAWCSSFGRSELGLAERFLPDRSVPRSPQTVRSAAMPQRAIARVRNGASRATPPAVRLTGYLRHSLGLGAAARAYAQALAAVDVPVSTNSVPLHHLDLPEYLSADYGRHSFEDLVHQGRHGVELVAVNADELPGLVSRLGEDYFEGPRVGIWGWETNAIPRRWAEAFSLVDEIWVYSRFMAENIGAAAPVPVLAMPPPVSVPQTPVDPIRLSVPPGYTFLFVFDYLSTIQRKNPVGLIEAFRTAFAPSEGPRLIVKTINAPLRPLDEEELLWAAHGREDIHIIDRSLTGTELSGLMSACDCYVSLHRSEGFGLTMAEAMAMSKPVIATRYSGNVDFMDDANSFLVDWHPGRVGPECEIYPPQGEWAEPDVEHAARLMRSVYEDPTHAALVGERARRDIAARLSPQVTGERMRKRLEELSARR
jgi:glycosyltransferase involved in cell wall biosynthesis